MWVVLSCLNSFPRTKAFFSALPLSIWINGLHADSNIEVGQGITTNSINAELQASYLINPASNLKLFANVNYRNFNPDAETISVFENSTVWFNIGIRTDLFNWYFDL